MLDILSFHFMVICSVSILFQDSVNIDDDHWLQYNFGEDRYLTEVKSRSRPGNGQRITSYQIQTWQDNQWLTVSDVDNNPIVSQHQ